MTPHALGVLLIPASALLLGACAAAPERSAPSAPYVDGRYYVECELPRPEACPRHMEPVCGYNEAGREDYPNPCMACKDSRVHGYRRGECPRLDPAPELPTPGQWPARPPDRATP